jgi:hypothetical protein
MRRSRLPAHRAGSTRLDLAELRAEFMNFVAKSAPGDPNSAEKAKNGDRAQPDARSATSLT